MIPSATPPAPCASTWSCHAQDAQRSILAVPFGITVGRMPEGRSASRNPSRDGGTAFGARRPSGRQFEPRRDVGRGRTKLGALEIRLPQQAAGVVETLKTAAAHILINRDGPALQPGPRRYSRSWIRDGALMGAALARVGLL